MLAEDACNLLCLVTSDSQLLNNGQYTRKLVVQRSTAGDCLKVYYVSLDHVGIDVYETFNPKYSYPLTNSRQLEV